MSFKKKAMKRALYDSPSTLTLDAYMGGTTLYECDSKKGCYVCGKLSSAQAPLRGCGKCISKGSKHVLYCSKECQRVDFPEHKEICGTDKENPGYWDDVGYTVRVPHLSKDDLTLKDWMHVYRRILIWVIRQAFSGNPDKKPPKDYLSIVLGPLELKRDDTGAEHSFLFPARIQFHEASGRKMSLENWCPSIGAMVSGQHISVDQLAICRVEYRVGGPHPLKVISWFVAPLQECGQDIHFLRYPNVSADFCPQWPWVFFTLCSQASKSAHTLDGVLNDVLRLVAGIRQGVDSKELERFTEISFGKGNIPEVHPDEWGRLLNRHMQTRSAQRKNMVSLGLKNVTGSQVRQLVEYLHSNPSDLCTRETVAKLCSSGNWKVLCDAAYFDFLVGRAAADMETSLGGLPAWCHISNEISNVLQATMTLPKPLSKETAKVLHQIRGVVTETLTTVILSSDPVAGLLGVVASSKECGWTGPGKERAYQCLASAGFLVASMALSFDHNPDFASRERFNLSGGIVISMLCWLYGDGHISGNRGTKAITRLFHEPASAKLGVEQFLLIVAGEHVAKRCKSMLQENKTPDLNSLQIELVRVLCGDSISCPGGAALGEVFVKHGLHEVVFAVTDRLLDQNAVTWVEVSMYCQTLQLLLHRSHDISATLMEYIEKFQVLKLISRVFVNGSPPDEGDYDYCVMMLTTIHHFMLCKRGDCFWPGSEQYIHAVRLALNGDNLWGKTISVLKKGARLENLWCKNRMKYWTAIGLSAGLDLDQSGAPRLFWEGCQWKDCVKAGEGLLRCSGCRLVCYCSKGCQRNDWKAGHKLRCVSKISGPDMVLRP